MPRLHHTALRITVVAAIVLTLTACDGKAQGPNPTLSPRDVVRIQMAALQHNDSPTPDHGITVAYRFASPQNRAYTGPLPQFATMIHNNYGDMLNWIKADYAPIIRHGDQAFELVTLVTARHTKAEYVFVLSRQTDAPHKGCWLTDSVVSPSPTQPPSESPPLERQAI